MSKQLKYYPFVDPTISHPTPFNALVKRLEWELDDETTTFELQEASLVDLEVGDVFVEWRLYPDTDNLDDPILSFDGSVGGKFNQNEIFDAGYDHLIEEGNVVGMEIRQPPDEDELVPPFDEEGNKRDPVEYDETQGWQYIVQEGEETPKMEAELEGVEDYEQDSPFSKDLANGFRPILNISNIFFGRNLTVTIGSDDGEGNIDEVYFNELIDTSQQEGFFGNLTDIIKEDIPFGDDFVYDQNKDLIIRIEHIGQIYDIHFQIYVVMPDAPPKDGWNVETRIDVDFILVGQDGWNVETQINTE